MIFSKACIYASAILVAALATLPIAHSSEATEVLLNVSGSDIEPTGSDTFVQHNVMALGFPGSYWIEFKWDAANLAFVPVEVGGEDFSPPSVDMRGTYRLTWFTVKYSNGFTVDSGSASASGTMRVDNLNWHQAVTVNGKSASTSGAYSIEYQRFGGGTVRVWGASGTYPLTYWTSNHEVIMYSGTMNLGSGVTFEEWDHWTKISGAASATSGLSAEQRNDSFRWLGEMLWEGF